MTKPGMMNAAPPSSAPGRPRTRQAQKIASCVEAGPGSRLQAAIASSNSTEVSHCLRPTHRSRSNLIWAGGPPKPIHPMSPCAYDRGQTRRPFEVRVRVGHVIAAPTI